MSYDSAIVPPSSWSKAWEQKHNPTQFSIKSCNESYEPWLTMRPTTETS